MGCYSLCQLARRLSAPSALLLYMDLTSGVARHTLATCWREHGKTVFIRIPQTLFSRSFFCQTIPIPFSSNLFSSDSSNESSPFFYFFTFWSSHCRSTFALMKAVSLCLRQVVFFLILSFCLSSHSSILPSTASWFKRPCSRDRGRETWGVWRK